MVEAVKILTLKFITCSQKSIDREFREVLLKLTFSTLSFEGYSMSILLSNVGPQQRAATPPIVAQIDPPVSGPAMRQYPIGTFWINTVSNVVFTLTSVSNGQGFWQETIAGAPGVFTNLTITPGPTDISGTTHIEGTNNVAEVIRLRENAGPAGSIEIASLQGTGPDSISITSGAGGIEIATAAPAGPIVISSDASTLSLGAGADSNDALLVNLNGGALSSIGIINNTGTNNATSHTTAAIHLLAPAGGIAIDAAEDFSMTGDDSSIIEVVTGDLSLLADVGDINLDATLGAIQLTADTDIRIDPTLTLTMAPSATVTDIEIGNVTPIVPRDTTINGGAVISAVVDTLNLATGGVNTNAAAEKVVNIASGATDLGLTEVNIGDGNVLSGTHFVNISTGTNDAGVKIVDIGNAAGGTTINAMGLISLNGGATGAVSVAHVQVATAAPGPSATAAATNNVRVGSVTFSGFTQAASATVALTLTNSFIAVNSCIIATATNVGAADAQMSVTRIFPGVGSALIVIKNNGAAALNGNMQLNFWVLS